jgi:multiple sugar transport system ATP-binding protein
MSAIICSGVDKAYGSVKVIEDFNLVVADREFIVFLGPSGCGKSTLLRMIAGLEEISGGDVTIGGTRVNDLEPRERGVAMVFQNYALYPHMTIYDNIAFGLKRMKVPAAEIAERIRAVSATLGLEPYLERKPAALSGGQQQRVAIARAMIKTPEVFLFDEPLSNLDAKLRNHMRVEIARLHQSLKTTTIYVTHDQLEAMTLADRIVLMRAGAIEQVGTPAEIYGKPRTLFAAGFIGTPNMNFIDVTMNRAAEGWVLESAGGRFLHSGKGFALKPGAKAVLGIRPPDLRAVEPGSSDANLLAGTADLVEFHGNDALVSFLFGGIEIGAQVKATLCPRPGQAVCYAADEAHIHLFDKESGLTLATG